MRVKLAKLLPAAVASLRDAIQPVVASRRDR
jgi:hypothetical protein